MMVEINLRLTAPKAIAKALERYGLDGNAQASRIWKGD
jgi:hypothetical protein